jgi:hypothetical protein
VGRDAKKQRKKAKRPCLQWNRIPVYVQQVVNDGRQNKPRIRIAPGDGGDPHTAEYFQARIRHIEYEANADIAKDTARDQQVTSAAARCASRRSTSPARSISASASTGSRISSPSCGIRPRCSMTARTPTGASSSRRFRRTRTSGSTAKNRIVNRLDFAEAMQLAPDWIGIGDNSEMIQIAEYFVKEYSPRRSACWVDRPSGVER